MVIIGLTMQYLVLELEGWCSASTAPSQNATVKTFHQLSHGLDDELWLRFKSSCLICCLNWSGGPVCCTPHAMNK